MSLEHPIKIQNELTLGYAEEFFIGITLTHLNINDAPAETQGLSWGRSYLMCPPDYFGVFYEINPWMHTENAVDQDRAQEQWHRLVANLRRAGATVKTMEPVKSLPDIVFKEAIVTIITLPQTFNEEELYVDLRSIFGHPLFLKCEGFNFAGSIKLKAANEMVAAAEQDGVLTPGSILVESSSGNMGVALSMIAASRGYRFLCVTDLRCNLSTRLLMEALGCQLHVITEPDANGGGLLGARLAYIRALCASDDRYVWLNQYTNPHNWKAHYHKTAPAIARQFPRLDVLFVGAGTTGTLMGCARFFREWHRPVRVVAVDSVGSVVFGGSPGRRMIPGLGAAVRPPLLDESYVDEVVRVEEADTIRACHRLARRGFLFGGSTGTVVSGAMDWLAQHDARELTAVAIAPDLGERYLDTIYQANWLQDVYGEDVLTFDELTDREPVVSLNSATEAVFGPAVAPAAR